jgi:Rha family phage regulatory protein
MKQLVPMDSFGIFVDMKDTARANSLIVAETFKKEHRRVLQDIRDLDCSDEFRLHNFVLSSYKNDQGKKQPCYEMTRDGFTFLAMGYRGKKAAQFKEAYIKRFNEMEKFISTVVNARKDFPFLTEHIKLVNENPRPYHFSNECDMLNRIATGMGTKQFRQLHNIPKGESIRPKMTREQIELLDTLQKVDIGLLIAVPNFEQRKRQLEWVALKQKQRTSRQKEALA